MITLSGTLLIRLISSHSGVFSVGRLRTGIGEFVVKDKLLDRYPEGQYQGEFGVSRIFPASYLAGGRLVIEIRASLAFIRTASVQAESVQAPEPSPVKIEPPSISTEEAEPLLVPYAAPDQKSASPSDHAENGDDATLFGVSWPLETTVKLDSTLERSLLRRQRDRLKQMGYRFEMSTQTWSLPP